MRRLVPLLLPVLLLAGCASVQRLAASVFAPPRLHLDRTTVVEVDQEGSTIQLDFTVENPNDLGFRVARATWRLQVEGAEVSEGALPGGVALPAREKSPFQVMVRLRWAEVERLAERALRQPQVAYRLEGTISVNTPAGVVTLPWSHRGELPVPRLPEVRLERVTVGMGSLTELELGLVLEVRNPNGFALPGLTLRFDLLLDGEVLLSGREATMEPVAAHGEARLTLPLRLSLLGGGPAAALHGGGALRLRGTLRAGGREVPLDLSIRPAPTGRGW
jgi:LEA14-like dessication related protein